MSGLLTAGVLQQAANMSTGGLIPLENLVLHLAADNIQGLNDNDPIEIWQDQSPFNNNAIQPNSAQRPVYRKNVTQGIDGIQFLGNEFFTLGKPAI